MEENNNMFDHNIVNMPCWHIKTIAMKDYNVYYYYYVSKKNEETHFQKDKSTEIKQKK